MHLLNCLFLIIYGSQLKKLILAALDTTISGHHVDHELLEADENGYTPDHQEFQGPSCYEFITKNGFEVSFYISNNWSQPMLMTFVSQNVLLRNKFKHCPVVTWSHF